MNQIYNAGAGGLLYFRDYYFFLKTSNPFNNAGFRFFLLIVWQKTVLLRDLQERVRRLHALVRRSQELVRLLPELVRPLHDLVRLLHDRV